MNSENAQFRATAGQLQALGTTPQDALRKLMRQLNAGTPTPIVIWPFNRGDAFYSAEQQTRLQFLKQQITPLTVEEREELEQLVEAAFDATIPRTRSIPSVKA